jgi:hypothetical protein
MKRVLLGGMVAAVSSWVMVGCQGEAAPSGYHHEMVDNGKRKEQVTVADPDPAQANKPIKVMVPTNSDVPGPGDYYVYVTEGKRTSRVLVHDEEFKGEPQGLTIEVSPDQVCPRCKASYVNVGKHVEKRFFCNTNVHVPPNGRGSEKTKEY